MNDKKFKKKTMYVVVYFIDFVETNRITKVKIVDLTEITKGDSPSDQIPAAIDTAQCFI